MSATALEDGRKSRGQHRLTTTIRVARPSCRTCHGSCRGSADHACSRPDRQDRRRPCRVSSTGHHGRGRRCGSPRSRPGCYTDQKSKSFRADRPSQRRPIRSPQRLGERPLVRPGAQRRSFRSSTLAQGGPRRTDTLHRGNRKLPSLEFSGFYFFFRLSRTPLALSVTLSVAFLRSPLA
jgi:hypothetical protein